jgi:alkylated DNA repair protein alkB family protein 1
MQESVDQSATVFKRAQGRHRRRGDNPNRLDDLDELVDFSRGQDERITPLSLPQNTSDLQNIYRGPIYGLKGFPGVLYAPQALTESLQFDLAYNCVSKFCERPHTTNIDQCPPKKNEELNSDGKMWELWKEDNRKRESSTKKQKVDHSARKKYRSFKKLSWATMGYHYDWTERSYDEACKSDMPSLVGYLSTMFARTSMLLEPTTKSPSFTPSASIVNYYNTKSLMGGHRDDLEFAMDKPIVSLSIGLSAVFLLGGKTKDEEPVIPILIRSGDVLCMGGESRLNYHAMARLVPSTVSIPDFDNHPCPTIDQKVSLKTLSLQASDVSKDDHQALEDYLSHHRININVRQVYPDPD